MKEVKIKFSPGTDIKEACREASDMANKEKIIVNFDFNDVKMSIYPGHSVAQDIAAFWSAISYKESMIKPNELRIGNFLRTEAEGTIRVQSIINDQPQYCKIQATFKKLYFNINNCEAIPITNEWLERFGFKKCEEWNGASWDYDEFHLWRGSNWDYYQYSAGSEDCNNMPDIELKYVHQLQNLYYTIKGKDLQIKN